VGILSARLCSRIFPRDSFGIVGVRNGWRHRQGLARTPARGREATASGDQSDLHDLLSGFQGVFPPSRSERGAGQDLLQETFVKVLRSIDSWSGAGAFEAWLWTIARIPSSPKCAPRR
jgi:hypothetical protein